MSGRELSIAYKAITVNELSGDLVAVSGEAVFAGDVDYQGVFYFGASCLATDAGVLDQDEDRPSQPFGSFA